MKKLLSRVTVILALVTMAVVPAAEAQSRGDLGVSKIAPAVLTATAPGASLPGDAGVRFAREVNDSYWLAVEGTVATALRHTHDEAVASGMQIIISELTRPAAQGRFRQSIPDLLAIYASHPNRDMRLMVVATLHAMQDPASMDILDRLVTDETDRRVRRTALRVLADFYEQRYLSNNG